MAGLTTATQTNTSPVTVSIPVGSYSSSGTLQLDPVGGGTTTITASAPGYASTSDVVTVTQPAITLNDAYVGSGLQVQHSGSLGGSQHGGVTVRVSSGDPARFKVAKLATDPGTSFVDIPVTNGQTSFSYYLQGEPGATGTATSPLFTTDTATVTLAPARLSLVSMPATTTAAAANDAFWVQIEYQYSLGCPSCWTTGQYVSSGAGPLTVTLTSSNLASAGLTTLNQTTTSPVSVVVPANSGNSPTSKATGGVELDPVAAGSTSVGATATGFTAASQSVTVNP